MIKVVGLSGVARAGKDEAANALVNQLGFVKRSLSQPLTDALDAMNPIVGVHPHDCKIVRYAEVSEMLGYEEGKNAFPEYRRLLQVYGTEGGRHVHGENCWVDLAFKWAEDNGVTRLVLPNVRFPNEAAAVEERQGLVYRIERPGTGAVNEHASDNALTADDFHPDMIISNNGDITALHRSLVRRVLVTFDL